MFSAARTRLTTNAAARKLPAASGPKRALSSTSPLANLFLSLLLLGLLMLCAEAHILPAEQHVFNDAAVTPKSILAVRAELIKAEIIPTVVDDFLPYLTLNVTWPSNQTADLGNTIKPDYLQKAPAIKLDDEPSSSSAKGPCKSNMTYVLAMTDPDAPSRDNPEWSEFCHWIIAGVPISDALCANEDSSLQNPGSAPAATQTTASGLKEIMEYYPPGPPPKTWKHRYVFLAFAPANSTSQPMSLTKPKDRKNWGTGEERHGVRHWAEENGLVPVAANFIHSKNEKQ